MSSVFVVETGYYSDKGIDSIWSTRELAEMRVVELNKNPYPNDPRVDEWYLDNAPPDSRPLWVVRFSSDRVTCSRIGEVRGPHESMFFVEVGHKYQAFGNAAIFVHADDEATAIKVASERRAAAMAMTWPAEKIHNGWVTL